MTSEILDKIIDETGIVYLRNPDIFLTESDAKSYLYSALLNTAYGKLGKTKDGSESISLHSEVRWYGYTRPALKYRSDLVLINLAGMETIDEYNRLPSKGFGFNEFYAIIEIKLRRINGPNDDKFTKAIKKDLDKLVELHKNFRENHEAKYFLIIFDKMNNINSRVSTFIAQNYNRPYLKHYYFNNK